MSEEQDLDTMLNVGDETVSLADIANLDMEGVAEVRFSPLPKMIGVFKCTSMKLDVRDTKKQGKKPVIAATFEVVGVNACFDDEIEPESLIGRKHSEAWYLGVGDPPNLVEDIGRWKAFLADSGFTVVGNTNQICEAVVDHIFVATIQHRKDPNDSDVTYSSFNMGKIKPYDPAASEAA